MLALFATLEDTDVFAFFAKSSWRQNSRERYQTRCRNVLYAPLIYKPFAQAIYHKNKNKNKIEVDFLEIKYFKRVPVLNSRKILEIEWMPKKINPQSIMCM
jgi:hypothetical protein